jgi:Polysaccharide lyase
MLQFLRAEGRVIGLGRGGPQDGRAGRRRRGARSRMLVALLLALAAVVTALIHEDAGSSPVTEAFIGDFEVGLPGWQQFEGLQYEWDRPLADSYALVDTPVRQGQRAVRLTARHGYSPFGYNESSMLIWDGHEQDGDEYWYAWSTLFSREWTSPYRWGIFAEWHAILATSPLISFDARGNSANIRLLSGLTDQATNTAAVDRAVPLLSTLSKGRWNDFVMRVRWSTRSDGLVDVYHRVEGARSLRWVVSFRGVPTFQMAKDGSGVGTYLLLGLYRASHCSQPTQLGCTSSLGAQPPNALYHDGFVRARTFEEAASRAFPEPTRLPPSSSRPVQQEGWRLAPVELRVVSRPNRAQTDRGCRRCRVVSPTKARFVASIAGAGDDRDTAVLTYRVKQRDAVLISHRLSVVARRLTGPLTVTQLRGPKEQVLAELNVGTGGTLRLSSPPGALRRQGFDVETGIAAGPFAEKRTVELRLARNHLLLAVDGYLVVRLTNLDGPRRGKRLNARVGIDRYDGRAGGGPIRAVFDEPIVGAS